MIERLLTVKHEIRGAVPVDDSHNRHRGVQLVRAPGRHVRPSRHSGPQPSRSRASFLEIAPTCLFYDPARYKGNNRPYETPVTAL